MTNHLDPIPALRNLSLDDILATRFAPVTVDVGSLTTVLSVSVQSSAVAWLAPVYLAFARALNELVDLDAFSPEQISQYQQDLTIYGAFPATGELIAQPGIEWIRYTTTRGGAMDTVVKVAVSVRPPGDAPGSLAEAAITFFLTDAGCLGYKEWEREAVTAPSETQLRFPVEVGQHPAEIWANHIFAPVMPTFAAVAAKRVPGALLHARLAQQIVTRCCAGQPGQLQEMTTTFLKPVTQGRHLNVVVGSPGTTSPRERIVTAALVDPNYQGNGPKAVVVGVAKYCP